MHIPNWLALSLTAISALVAILVGFVLTPAAEAISFVRYFGYYVIAACALTFFWTLFRLIQNRPNRYRWGAADWRIAMVALAGSILWQTNGDHAYKILMDELVLNGTSLSMHFEREVSTPMSVHEVDGAPFITGGYVDKRPVFFPFLLATVHDLTGYRSTNPFILNAGLSFILLVLAGQLGRRLGNHEKAGHLAVLLLLGLPLLGLNATGGGFEILNLVMIAGVMLLAIHFANRPDASSQNALIAGAILLAQTRYESALYVVPVGIVILWSWWQQRRILPTWVLGSAPLLLILVPLQHKVFEANERFWQMSADVDAPFAFEFLFNNLGHAVRFLFALDEVPTSSLLLTATGIVCTLFALVFTARRIRPKSEHGELIAYAAFASAILAGFFLILCYFWGQLDDFVVTRLGLPLQLLFAISAAFVAGRLLKGKMAWSIALLVAGLWIWTIALPTVAQDQGTRSYLAFQEVSWQRKIVRAHDNDSVLFVMRSPLAAIIERKPAIPTEKLAEHAEQMAFHLDQHTYGTVLVFQRLHYNPKSEGFEPIGGSELGPEFILQTIEERRFKPLFAGRLSRLEAIDLSRRLPRPEGWQPKFPMINLSGQPEQRDPAEAFIENYIHQLP